MKSIYRSLAVGFSAGVLSLAGSLAWAAPFTASAAATAVVLQNTAQSSSYTGTIVKAGDDYVLRDSSGTVYKLDDSSKAKSFEGKQVKVTGKLDTDSKTIHVESIEGAS